MRKFIITSNKTPGQIELVYNEQGNICLIDLNNVKLNSQQFYWLAKTTPFSVDLIEQCFNVDGITVIEGAFEVTFDMFWEKYNKKINKKRCYPLWNKLDKVKQVKAYLGIAKYDKFLTTTTRGKLDPENYLRNEAWENEWK